MLAGEVADQPLDLILQEDLVVVVMAELAVQTAGLVLQTLEEAVAVVVIILVAAVPTVEVMVDRVLL
jgi:hypothetical protein